MEVGEKIKAFLEKNGITQAYISRRTEINSVKLNLALNGKRKLTFDEYCLICGALGVEAGYFLIPRLPDEKGANKST